MPNSKVDIAYKTFIAAEAIPRGRRVVLSAAGAVSLAGATNDYDAVSIDAAAIGESVNCQLKGQGGTFLIETAGAVAAIAACYPAADGKVDDAAVDTATGKFNELAGAAGVLVEVVGA